MFTKNLTKALTACILDSSGVGFVKYFKSKHLFQKLLWILFIIASFSTCGYFIYLNIQNYLNFSYITQTDTIYEQPVSFPSILFCASNFKNQTLNNIIIDCNVRNDNRCKINPNYFFKSTKNGFCFKFTSGEKSLTSGIDDSISLKILAPNGIRVLVYNLTYTPRLALNAYFINPTGQSQFIIDKTISTKLGFPYNNCLKDISTFTLNKTLIEYVQNRNEIYNQINCYDLCFELKYLESNKCNCTSSLGDVWEMCYLFQNFLNVKECTFNFKMDFYLNGINDKCSQYCDSAYYLINYNSFNGNEINVTGLNVYYRSLEYTFTHQYSILAITDLISNIGWTFSLFVGFSFITIFEIIELIFRIIYVLFKGNGKKDEYDLNQN